MCSHGDKHHLTLLLDLVIKCMKIVFEHEKSFGGEIFCKNAIDNPINRVRRNVSLK